MYIGQSEYPFSPGFGGTSFVGFAFGETGGELKDRYPLSFTYPKGLVRDASAISESEFKKQYFEALVAEIARYHVDSKLSNGIADGR